MRTSTRTKLICVLVLGQLAACGGSESGPPPTQYEADAVGGIWIGTTSFGFFGDEDIYAVSTETGEIHWMIPATGEQGFGSISAENSGLGSDLTILYTYVASVGSFLEDGSNSADCAVTGHIRERESIEGQAECITRVNGTFYDGYAQLSYSSLYDQESSLAAIAGNYDDFGPVLNVNEAGEIFEQDPASECIASGQVSIIDARYNVYDIWVSYSNCVGDSAVLNGARFEGLGTLDNSVNPEQAIFGLVGEVDGVTHSMMYELSRL